MNSDICTVRNGYLDGQGNGLLCPSFKRAGDSYSITKSLRRESAVIDKVISDVRSFMPSESNGLVVSCLKSNGSNIAICIGDVKGNARKGVTVYTCPTIEGVVYAVNALAVYVLLEVLVNVDALKAIAELKVCDGDSFCSGSSLTNVETEERNSLAVSDSIVCAVFKSESNNVPLAVSSQANLNVSADSTGGSGCIYGSMCTCSGGLILHNRILGSTGYNGVERNVVVAGLTCEGNVTVIVNSRIEVIGGSKSCKNATGNVSLGKSRNLNLDLNEVNSELCANNVYSVNNGNGLTCVRHKINKLSSIKLHSVRNSALSIAHVVSNVVYNAFFCRVETKRNSLKKVALCIVYVASKVSNVVAVNCDPACCEPNVVCVYRAVCCACAIKNGGAICLAGAGSSDKGIDSIVISGCVSAKIAVHISNECVNGAMPVALVNRLGSNSGVFAACNGGVFAACNGGVFAACNSGVFAACNGGFAACNSGGFAACNGGFAARNGGFAACNGCGFATCNGGVFGSSSCALGSCCSGLIVLAALIAASKERKNHSYRNYDE